MEGDKGVGVCVCGECGCVCVWVCRDWVVGVEGEKEVGRNRVSVCVCVCVYEGRDEKVRGADQGVWRNL